MAATTSRRPVRDRAAARTSTSPRAMRHETVTVDVGGLNQVLDGALVEAWLQARGFTLPRAPEPDEEHEKALAIA